MKKTLLILIVISMAACNATIPTPKNLLNKNFPQVQGQSLTDQKVLIPDSFRNKVTVLLIGYQQKTQFDIDRWILGILQAEIPVTIVEVPTIAGMMPQMVQGFIDNGMRSGIPEKDWASVVTVYEDAAKIIEAIGNERPQSTHVVLLDKQGQIIWTNNLGYSAAHILELKQIIKSLP
jgi:hypothetical protein